MFGEPPGERRQPLAPDAINSPSALNSCCHQPGSLQALQVLNDGRARNRQTARELARGTGRTRQALKNDYADRMAEQREQTQQLPELCRLGVGFRHFDVSRPTNTFDSANRRLLYSIVQLQRSRPMINGAHIIVYSTNADADRAFIKDVLKFKYVDVNNGWLIFKLPPSELAVHPSDENDMHELYLMTDDLDLEIRALQKAGVKCDDVSQQRWGRSTRISLPGGGTLGLYQPRHERPQ